jgi:fucose permease
MTKIGRGDNYHQVALLLVMQSARQVTSAAPAMSATREIRFLGDRDPLGSRFMETGGTIPLLSTTPLELRADPGEEQILETSQARRALGGFFLSGLLMSFLGAILPVWGYHLSPDLTAAGNYFLCLNVGILGSLAASQKLLPRKGIAFTLALACGIACAAFLFLALTSPPASAIWRAFGLLWLGLAAGLLNASVFHAISPLYRHDRASTVNLGGTLFGLGCLVTAVLVAGTYYVYNVSSILILFAAVPGLYTVVFARARFAGQVELPQVPWRQVLDDFRNPGAILFALLLFFQFGNEWSIAGWLSLFLIRRLGISPEASIGLLALYWAALLVGRVVAQGVLKRGRHAILLLGSVVSALLGCGILSFTINLFGACMGILFVAAGFAFIYPLVVEKIAKRFPYYHPGFYNGIFSFAFTGGLLAPWMLGYMAQAWGIQTVMVIPLVGTCVVFLLVLLILLDARLSGLEERR